MRGPDEKLFEEAYDWAQDLTDAECMMRHLVGLDVNLSFAAGANGAVVGLASPPVHVTDPAFERGAARLLAGRPLPRRSVPGEGGQAWRDLDGGLLPSPFTPSGRRPTGPAWYATPTVAYAVEAGLRRRAF
ncbi:hypothetical protein ACE6JH_35620 [Streptomyces nigra]